jgi:hypothetical protein
LGFNNTHFDLKPLKILTLLPIFYMVSSKKPFICISQRGSFFKENNIIYVG